MYSQISSSCSVLEDPLDSISHDHLHAQIVFHLVLTEMKWLHTARTKTRKPPWWVILDYISKKRSPELDIQEGQET